MKMSRNPYCMQRQLVVVQGIIYQLFWGTRVVVAAKAAKDLTPPQLLDLKQLRGLLLQITILFQTHGAALVTLNCSAVARSNSTGNARTLNIGGLGGLCLPEIQGIFGTPDSSALNQLMQSPAVSQMMQILLSYLQYLDQILGFSPQLRSMLGLNPQLREVIQNPEILCQLTSPDTLQQMFTLQQQISQLIQHQHNLEGAQTVGITGTQNNVGLGLPFNIFGGLGAGGLAVPNTTSVAPEELYATQLSQLREMGFFDTEENIRALRAASGNVQGAVERLLGNHGL